MTTRAEAQARTPYLLGMARRGRALTTDHGARSPSVPLDPFRRGRPRPPTYIYRPVEDEQTGDGHRTYWAQ